MSDTCVFPWHLDNRTYSIQIQCLLRACATGCCLELRLTLAHGHGQRKQRFEPGWCWRDASSPLCRWHRGPSSQSVTDSNDDLLARGLSYGFSWALGKLRILGHFLLSISGKIFQGKGNITRNKKKSNINISIYLCYLSPLAAASPNSSNWKSNKNLPHKLMQSEFTLTFLANLPWGFAVLWRLMNRCCGYRSEDLLSSDH